MLSQPNVEGGAAKVCDDYINTDTGTGVYTDWFLPSLDELLEIARNKAFVPNYNDNIGYWSSSEQNSTDAYSIKEATPRFFGKHYFLYTRAVRAF